MTFGERLKLLRKEKGMTLQEVAAIFKSGKTTFSNYENDYRKPDMELICDIADYFKVSVDFLLGRTEERNPERKRFFTLKELLEISPSEYKNYFTEEDLKYIEFTLDLKKDELPLEAFKTVREAIIQARKSNNVE